VNNVIVEGLERHNVEELSTASNIRQGQMLLFLPIERISQDLLNTFPYLQNVQIRLQLPDTVTITVTERQAIAYIDQDEQRWVIDRYGRLLEFKDIETKSVGFELRGIYLDNPQVNTYINSPERRHIQTYELLLEALREHGLLQKLDYIDLTGLADITFSINEQFTVRLGDISDYDYKLNLLHSVLVQLAENRPNARGTISLIDAPERRRAVFSEEFE